MPVVLCFVLGRGKSSSLKWSLVHPVCPVAACFTHTYSVKVNNPRPHLQASRWIENAAAKKISDLCGVQLGMGHWHRDFGHLGFDFVDGMSDSLDLPFVDDI